MKINPREFAGVNQPPGFLPHEDKEPVQDGDKSETDEKLDSRHELNDHFLDRFARHIAEDEKANSRSQNDLSQQQSSSSMDASARNTYNFVYVLLKELVMVMADLPASPPKKYSYRDWAWYLKLLGQDEADSALHRQPKRGTTDRNIKPGEIGTADGDEEDRMWSWLGIRSPLMSTKSEAEWIAARLSSRLEHELDCLRTGREGDKVPLSFEDVLKRKRPGSNDEGKVNLEKTD